MRTENRGGLQVLFIGKNSTENYTQKQWKPENLMTRDEWTKPIKLWFGLTQTQISSSSDWTSFIKSKSKIFKKVCKPADPVFSKVRSSRAERIEPIKLGLSPYFSKSSVCRKLEPHAVRTKLLNLLTKVCEPVKPNFSKIHSSLLMINVNRALDHKWSLSKSTVPFSGEKGNTSG